MFRDIAYADRDGDEWLEVSSWDDVTAERHAWRGAQVWTRNTIYELDHAMRCISVIRRATGEEEDEHPMLGQHLVGAFGYDPGEPLLEEKLPEPGRSAVFSNLRMRPATLRRTSPVERIRIRMRPAPAERLSEPFHSPSFAPAS